MSGQNSDTEVLFLRVPADLKHWLNERAERLGISLNAQAIVDLQRVREAEETRTAHT